MQTPPATFLKVLAPSRAGLVGAVACRFTGSWLADLCPHEGIPVVLGHALYMKAIHGGKATHDTIDAHTVAVLLRGGRRPQASVSPTAMRATRALLRRRMPLMHQRAERVAHLRPPTRQYHLPDIGKQLASHANRDDVAERFPEPAVPKRIDVDRALLAYDAELLGDVALTIRRAANQHDANTRDRGQTIPGIGKLRSLVLLYDIYDIHRVPRVQEGASSGRLVKCAKDSNGKRAGSSGTTIGTAHLQWTLSEAAVLFLRDHPAGQPRLVR